MGASKLTTGHGRAALRCKVSQERRNLSRAITRRSPRKSTPPTGVLLALLFRFQESAEFQFDISPRTRRDYIKQIKRIEKAFGDFPIKAAGRSGHASALSRMARQAGANIAAPSGLRLWHPGANSVMGAWSPTDHENPCAKGGKLYHGTRVDKIWDDEQVARFLRFAPPYLRLAMLLAINTGQRQGDLLRLPWSAYDGEAIKLRQRKTGVMSRSR